MTRSSSLVDGGVFIADTSAWWRSSSVKESWTAAMRSRQIATCPIVMLELLYSAPDGDAFQALERDLRQLRDIPVTRSITQAAIAALRELAEAGSRRHRVEPTDAVIAACAQEAGIGVLHCDRHFDRLAEVMSFESRWLLATST
jgi:predicted nucleic acid-binding protein